MDSVKPHALSCSNTRHVFITIPFMWIQHVNVKILRWEGQVF